MEQPTSLYSKQHPKIRRLFEQAGSAAKTLCVAMDYAKAQHLVLFCNGLGDVLKKPFAVENSPPGLDQLLAEVRATCAHRGIKPQHVFFGGEDHPAYVQNFLHRLCAQGYLVVRVDAAQAKHQRDNHQASTDTIDVRAIAKTLLHQASFCDQDQSQSTLALKELSRTRAHFVGRATEQKLQIHHYVSRLFPSFLNVQRSGISPFSQASLALMAAHFSPEQIRRRRRDHLVSFLRRHGQEDPAQAADQLRALASQVLAPAPGLGEVWQSALAQHVAQYQSLEQSIRQLDAQLARVLAQSPGALLTSINGIGVVLAAGLVSELGDPAHWRALRFVSSYVGIIPSVYQTGGPDQPAHSGSVRRRCNPRAKNWVVQAASQIGQHGPEELKAQYHQLRDNGQHADFIMGKRLLRLAKDLMRRGSVYRPKALLDPDTPPTVLSNHYAQIWSRLLHKWRGLVEWEQLFAADTPLGQWRQMVQALYKLSLSWPKKRSGSPT